MVSTKTIRAVDEMTWRKLRAMSAEQNLPLGRLLERIAEDYETRSRDVWKRILDGEKILSDKEAEGLLTFVKELRKEYRFR